MIERMKHSIYYENETKYYIAPSNKFIYFLWAIYNNFLSLTTPRYLRVFVNLEEAKDNLKEINKGKKIKLHETLWFGW